MNGEWLKLHRSFLTSDVWELGPHQTRLFIWILSRVDYKTGSMRTTTSEMGAGIEYLDRNTYRRPTRKSCMTYINQLEEVNSITVEVLNRRGVRLSVVNWHTYQGIEPVLVNSQETVLVNSQDPVEVEVEVEVESKETTSPKQITYSGICRELQDDVLSVPVFWKAHQLKAMEKQVARIGKDRIITLVTTNATRITSPRITDRSSYILKIVESYDPVVEAEADKHEGYVTCKCGKRHKILMAVSQRKHYWSGRGNQLSIRCGCGESTPTGMQMPSSYDVSTLKPFSIVEEAMSA